MVAIRVGEDNASRKDLVRGEEIIASVVKSSRRKGSRKWRGEALRVRGPPHAPLPTSPRAAHAMEPEQLNLLANTLADLKARSAEMRRLL
jgi:hypothetical protein